MNADMDTLNSILVCFIALQHITFLILEMFLWDTPFGHKVLKLEPSFAKASAFLAKNQGIYNGFLAAGLIWSLLTPEALFGHQLQIFFLSCVLVAGIVGALTASVGILFIQALPAAVALSLIYFN